ncbi:MAG: hydroxylamine reductase, partial [Selenomonadaceae bacterium]|nr:hydroxylamine reductase [Selenomonadaceae bacterium]
MESKNFLCFQCSDALGGKGCTKVGVCGKKADVARMQDLLIYVTKGISAVTTKLRAENKIVKPRVNHLITLNLFITITNANFDREAIVQRVEQTLRTKTKLLAEISDKKNLPAAALWTDTRENFDAKAETVGILATENEDIRSLRELIIYGLKGLCAYMKHANRLGYDSEEINAFAQATLAKLLDDSLSGDDLTALALETGKFGVDVMALLDKANTETYGNPEVTKVKLGVGKNPAILISGHDLRDLEQL